MKPYILGKDLVQEPERRFIVDFFGLNESDARDRFPELYQRILTTVKPERDQQTRESYRRKWWIFAEPRANFRPALAGLGRYIATCRTAKHRIFVFLDGTTVPDSKVVAIASDDAFHLGVLSSRIHVTWALASGAKLGIGNDPTYNNAESFGKFPFPACEEGAKARIRALGEELDAHRKRVQAQHPGLSLTAMYNVLAKLRAAERSSTIVGRLCETPGGPPAPPSDTDGLQLTPKDRAIHDAGLVSVLRQLHDELDAAVAAAYGWVRDGRPETDLTDAEILTRLVALNATRAAEEAAGQVRWLRPEYQSREQGAGSRGPATQEQMKLPAASGSKLRAPRSLPPKAPWPKPLAERVAAVERALAAAAGPVTAELLAKHFLRAKPADLAEILETLVTLGRAHEDEGRFTL